MANIAFILNKFPDGGIERVTMNLVGPLARNKGHKIFLFVNDLNEERLVGADLPVTYLHIPYPSWRKENRDAVYEAIIKEKIDILFSPCVSPKYIFEFKHKKICKVCFVLHSQPLYELTEKMNSVKNYHGSWVKTMKRILFKEMKFKLGIYTRRYMKHYKTVYKNVDAYGVLFDSYKKELAKELGVAPEKSKLFTLSNPVTPITETPKNGNREKRILFVGRLTHFDKRVDRLLDVWEKVYDKFPEWRLEIVGEGDSEEFLRDYVKNHNLPRVHFMGYSATPQTYYNDSEILCLTSVFEGLGMVLLEAQQWCCATIAYDCSSGVRNVLSPNWENGVYVPDGDVNAYAEALSRLMSDDELRRKIQLNGPKSAARFSVENSVEQYDAVIQKLLK